MYTLFFIQHSISHFVFRVHSSITRERAERNKRFDSALVNLFNATLKEIRYVQLPDSKLYV
jgi:hypothetical protein